MTMSTPILAEAARLTAAAVLIDSIQIYNVSEPSTVGIDVHRDLFPVGLPVNGLVQTTTLENAVEGRTNSTFSVKVALGTPLVAGQAVKVLFCRQEPDLSGRVLLIDKVSLNGAAVLRKAVASDYQSINQQGKGVIHG